MITEYLKTKIDLDGTPLYIRQRENGGVEISQGDSYLRLSDAEIDALVDVLRPGIRTPAKLQRFVNGVEQ